jgi:hypothetical protein
MAPEAMFTVKKLIGLADEMADQITRFRYDRRLPSDNEAIRILIGRGLSAPGSAEAPAATVPEPSIPQPQTYAPPEFYSAKKRPRGGWPWENREIARATRQANAKLPETLTVKLAWLSDQLKAAGVGDATQVRLITHALERFAAEELAAWGIDHD